MNFIIPILLEMTSSDEDCPCIMLPRQAVQALIEDWLRLGQEISRLHAHPALEHDVDKWISPKLR